MILSCEQMKRPCSPSTNGGEGGGKMYPVDLPCPENGGGGGRVRRDTGFNSKN